MYIHTYIYIYNYIYMYIQNSELYTELPWMGFKPIHSQSSSTVLYQLSHQGSSSLVPRLASLVLHEL